MIDGEVKWVETAISHMQLKSVIARVTRAGNAHASSASCSTTARRCNRSK